MTEYTASTLDEQVQEITDYINHEADSAAKSVRTQLIVLAVVSLILIFYFWILNKQIKDFTEPESLAQQAAILIDDNIPDLAGMIEGVMNDVSPQVADFISKQAVQQGVPYLVDKSEKFLDNYIDNMTSETAAYMDGAFNDVITDNKESLQEAIANEQSGDDPSQALKPLREKLHATFTDQTTGKRSEAGVAVDKSLVALTNLNRRLDELASLDPTKMDRKQKMSSRLLRTYWRWVGHRPEDAGVDDAPSGPVGADTVDVPVP